MIKIEIPFRTPTINHLYFHKGNMKILKTDARKLRDKIIEIIDNKHFNIEQLKDEQLDVRVEIFEDWLNLDETIKKKDLLNKEKFLVDSIFKALALDDKQIFKCSFIKRHSDTNKSIITINKLIEGENN